LKQVIMLFITKFEKYWLVSFRPNLLPKIKHFKILLLPLTYYDVRTYYKLKKTAIVFFMHVFTSHVRFMYQHEIFLPNFVFYWDNYNYLWYYSLPFTAVLFWCEMEKMVPIKERDPMFTAQGLHYNHILM
jgi:hypothetical protein